MPDWSSCEPTARGPIGFTDDSIRVGVRSFYEDWSFGNELFSAFLNHQGSVAGRDIEVVEVSLDGPPPEDLAVLVDFATSQIPLGLASGVPGCLPILARSYSQPPSTQFELAMPALTAPTEARLWATYLRQSVPDLRVVGALVIDHPSGDVLLDAFTEAIGSDVEIVEKRHELTSNVVASQVDALLAAVPDALVVMSFGEPCRQAVLSVEGSRDQVPPVRFLPSPCAFNFEDDSAFEGWLAFRQPALERGDMAPELIAALDLAGWLNFSDESAGILAGWWIVDALESGADDRQSLLEALLSTDAGPSWMGDDVRLATWGLDFPLAIEGAPLAAVRDGRWQDVDVIDLDNASQ